MAQIFVPVVLKNIHTGEFAVIKITEAQLGTIPEPFRLDPFARLPIIEQLAQRGFTVVKSETLRLVAAARRGKEFDGRPSGFHTTSAFIRR